MKNLKIAAKIAIVFLLIGLTGISFLGFISIKQSKNALMKKSFDQLIAIREIKKNQIENFFVECTSDIRILSEDAAVLSATEGFIKAFNSQGLNSGAYKKYNNLYENFFVDYIKEYDFYDLFLISPQGDVVYTVAKEADLGQNVASGNLSKSGLGEAFKKGKSDIGLIDFSWYDVSDEPASFIAGPLKNSRNELIGVLVYQISLHAIDNIMKERNGMGNTGETYLVGNDMLMRSNSYLDPEGHSVEASLRGNVQQNGVNTEASIEALAGNRGAKIVIDYNGNPVLSAFTPIKAGELKWALLAEIDLAEVLIPVNALVKHILFIALIIALVIIVTGILFARSISLPLASGVDYAMKLSEGDLTATLEMDRKDEIGILITALGNMGQKLKEIVHSIITSSDSITSASQQMSSASTQLSQSTNEQAASTEEASSSMEEMLSSIEQNANNARETESISVNAATKIAQGNKSVEETIEAMRLITEKISIIGEIAEKTDLLAINAAIEAARAGEHGKGFAVVASEIRKLAERSQNAASEINEVSVSSVKKADEAGKLLSQIVPEVQKTSGLVQEITAASLEQNSGASQINSTIQQITIATQQNASSSEELASSAEELDEQAKILKKVASFFRIEKNHLRFNTEENKNKVVGLKASGTKKETANNTKEVEIQSIELSDNEDFEKY